MPTDGPPTLKDRYLSRLLNTRVGAGVAVFTALVIALGTFTDALDGAIRFGNRILRPGRAARVTEYCHLLTPLIVQFDRTLSAFNNYRAHDFALEETLADGNGKARDLLTVPATAGLIPSRLDSARQSLVSHYDRWLEEYRRVRGIDSDSVQAFIFVGPDGHPFPQWAERAFRARRDSVAMYLGTDNIDCST